MTKVLITGAYGFLGRNTALKFKHHNYDVYACGHGNWKPLEYKQWGIDHWLNGDISIELLTQFNIKPDFIIHCAGSGSVGLSIDSPAQDFEKTVSGTLSVLEFIRTQSPNSKLIYPSSAAVYGEHIDAEIKVKDSLSPASPYGVHKKIVEELCCSYHDFFHVNCTIIRFFSIYGPGLKKQLLWDASNKIFSSQDKVLFWGTGEESRDWIYISDATDLIFSNANSSVSFSILNGGSGIRSTIKETLLLLADCLDTDRERIQFNGTIREGDPRFYLADITEAIELPWTPTIPLSEGLECYAKWYRTNHND